VKISGNFLLNLVMGLSGGPAAAARPPAPWLVSLCQRLDDIMITWWW